MKIRNIVFSMLLVVLGSFAFAESGVPRTFANAAPAGMKDVLALDAKLNPSEKELVVYYVRPDKDYKDWALWVWAIPGGDGGAAWPYTQNWKVQDGIGYMRLKLDGSSTGGTSLLSDTGNIGFIVRQKNEWVKDGNDDRLWNLNTSKKVVIFSRDQNTYAALDYKPSVKSAELYSLREIDLKLSGKYGLDTDGGDSGFTVVTSKGKEYKIANVVNTDSPENLAENMTDKVTIQLAEDVKLVIL